MADFDWKLPLTYAIYLSDLSSNIDRRNQFHAQVAKVGIEQDGNYWVNWQKLEDNIRDVVPDSSNDRGQQYVRIQETDVHSKVNDN